MSKDMEHALLGAVLTSKDHGLVDDVELDWFTCDATRAVIAAIRDASTTDLATIVSATKSEAAFRTERVQTFLAHVADKHLGSVSQVPKYIDEIRRDHETRQRRELGQQIAKTRRRPRAMCSTHCHNRGDRDNGNDCTHCRRRNGSLGGA